uniref:Uncharacterized protein n=1 Tax=Anopheles atroparvus TaxID=41427 RepID=A0AAG5DGL2_ANOAO
MTSQAVYCLSLQIRPSAEEGNATTSAGNGGGNEQLQQQLTVKPVAVAASGSATVVTSGTTTMVTSASGGASTLLSGLEKSGVTISAEASRALQSHAIQIAQSQVVTAGSSPATVTVATSQQHHHHQPQQQQQQHSNIILVRGSRSENGQIILQNTHELLSLLSDEDKPIFLQHQRLTTASSTAVAGKAQLTKALSESGATTAGSTILFQPTIKSGSLDGGGSSTILLQSSDGLKKGTTLDVTSASAGGGGPIFLQQRLSKNGTEGPILLRTLKRLDKSQSILVIRNATTASTAASAGHTTGGLSVSTAGGATLAKVKPISTPTTTVVTVTAAPAGSSAVSMAAAVARKAAEEAEEKKETTVTVTKVQHKSSNMPLGTAYQLFASSVNE